MNTMLTNSMSSLFKKTAIVLGMFSLVTTLTNGEVKADRIDANGRIVFSRGTWTQAVSSCTPDEDTIDYQMSGASVSFPGTITGEMTLRCNITNIIEPDRNWDILEVVYSDPDGSGTANQVTAELYRVDLGGTTEKRVLTTTVLGRPQTFFDPSLIATFDSNSGTTATAATQTRVVSFSHAFDFATNAYYVKVKVKRTAGSTTNPAAFIVRLYKDANIGG